MKTPYISYSDFKKEIQRKSETERSFFFSEKWIIEAWEGISNVESIYDEPFFKDYLSFIHPVPYLNWTLFDKDSSSNTDWNLLLQLIVSSSIVDGYDFVMIYSCEDEKYRDYEGFVYPKTRELTFRFKDLETHLLYFTSITEPYELEALKSPEIIQKIGIEVEQFFDRVLSFHSPLFDDPIYVSNLTQSNVDFLMKILIFQLIEDSKECHFVLNVNFPQNIEEILNIYKGKVNGSSFLN